MFTGIIQAVGRIAASQPQGGDMRFQIDAGTLDMSDVGLGDSIAVSGVCLTVTEQSPRHFWVDVSNETLRKTIMGDLQANHPVNLEKAMRPSDRLGGHLVAGHVDGVGEVIERRPEGRSEFFRLRAPRELARYIAGKGSITVDGISLTVNAVSGDNFDLNLIPHTLAETTAEAWRPGTRVNLEVDLLARYLERLMQRDETTITPEFLKDNGFS